MRWYSVSVSASAPEPVTLTPGDGAVEHTAMSADGALLFYTTNAGDIERRHLWKVPTAGGQAEQVTRGDTIETYPAVLASAKQVAVLGGDAKRPFGVGLVPAGGGSAKYIYPSLAGFPIDAEVVPQLVLTKAADGLEIHNQIFLPKDLKPGEKRPAIVFVHGGPVRQMLLGYHYMHFYHIAYAVNQWLASQGYVVMSINYRSGIGYGKSFRTAPNTAGRGNAEYQDVLAGGRYLQIAPRRRCRTASASGGCRTAACSPRRRSRGTRICSRWASIWQASISGAARSIRATSRMNRPRSAAIDTWKSPVLLIQGDDDRNVQFSQMTGLVQLLRAHGVYHEVIVFPDDVHETLLHKRYVYAFNRLSDFMGRFLKGAAPHTTDAPPK